MNNWYRETNTHKYGSDMWYHVEQQNALVDRLEREAQQPSGPPLQGYGEWASGIGICFFLFGILASHGAHGIAGHLLVMFGYALLGVALVTVVYFAIKGPKLLFRMIVWAARKSVFLRCLLFGALIGVAAGIGLAVWLHGDLGRAVTNVGIIGTVLGFVVGLVMSLLARARRGPAPELRRPVVTPTDVPGEYSYYDEYRTPRE